MGAVTQKKLFLERKLQNQNRHSLFSHFIFMDAQNCEVSKRLKHNTFFPSCKNPLQTANTCSNSSITAPAVSLILTVAQQTGMFSSHVCLLQKLQEWHSMNIHNAKIKYLASPGPTVPIPWQNYHPAYPKDAEGKAVGYLPTCSWCWVK